MLTKQQILERRNSIGGSDLGIILGLSNFKTRFELYCEKKGIIEPPKEIDWELDPYTPNPKHWGHQIEVVIRKAFRKLHKVKVETPKEAIAHPDYPFLRGHLDGYIPKWKAVFEAKTSNSHMKKYWGEPGTDTIPPAYLIQVAFYCAITDSDCGYIAVLIGGNEYREFKYIRDKELEKIIIQAACEFWDTLQKNQPPEPTQLVDIKLFYPEHIPGESKGVNTEILEHVLGANEVKQQMKTLQEKEKDYKFKILKYMETAECLVDAEGRTLATYKTNKRGSRTFLLKGVNNND